MDGGGRPLTPGDAAALGTLVFADSPLVLPAGGAGQGLPSVGRLVTSRSLAVYRVAVASYVLLAWSLLNQSLAFALSREDFGLWAVGPAVLVDLAVGIGLGHFVAYPLATVGQLAGAIVCCVLATRFGQRLVRDADYLFYAAF